MAGHTTKGSLRHKSVGPFYVRSKNGIEKIATMRPGKTREDKRIDAWMDKYERNDRQRMYAEVADTRRK